MTSRDLIIEAERRGAHFVIKGDRLEARPKSAFDARLAEEIGKRKPEIIDERQTREAALATEWRIDHDLFTIAREAEVDGELAACLACGGTWELHGSPTRDLWYVVDDATYANSPDSTSPRLQNGRCT